MKIGIDLGGSHIGIGIVENETIIEKREIDIMPAINQNGISLEDEIKKEITLAVTAKEKIQDYIFENIEELLKKYSIEKIGIAVPGTVNSGRITSLVNLGIKEWNLQTVLENQFHIPVQIHNDAKCAALAEKKYGALKNDTDCIFLCLGTGIGASVFLEGKQLVPKRNPGFEIGHMIIQKDGKLCNCGKKGCFETYCSIKRFKENLISALNLNKTTGAKELIQILESKKENEKVKKVIEKYLVNLLIGISNIIDIFEPETICLGGSFIYFKDILYIPFLEMYKQRKYVFNKEKLPEIRLGILGNDAGIIGATI